ncbi:MAG: hypothetical protein QF793_01685 [Candidatus Peribacteraceae bacterium]|jgi:hypothetical protein|nr:hypothetical protein [bacterium]MDP6561614.1 hypothetical protein [Candidatus Peribacteraceae bacterium]|tara:strand:+ start:3311 stop:5239 length:1929 start_codon:yes stop_codon:yes gene_type:complete
MEITVQTGHTRPKRGTTLIADSFSSSNGEDVAILIQVDGSPADAKTLEKECKTVIKHALLETNGDAAQRLDGTLKELNGLFKGLTFSQSVEEVHAILGIIDKSGVLHVSHAGRAEAYVVRGSGASQITEYTRGKPTPAFVHIASGALEQRDVIILSTQRLLRTVTPAQLAQLSQRGEHLLDELVTELESEKEQAAIGLLHVSGRSKVASSKPVKSTSSRRRRRKTGALSAVLSSAADVTARVSDYVPSGILGRIQEFVSNFVADLSDPKRKRRAHLLLLAGTVAAFLIIWAVANLSTGSQNRQSRAELETRLEEVNQFIRTAENRRLSGEMDSANTILEQAEQRAKQVMDNESNLFRAEALDLLERIRAKREEINNIVRLSPRMIVNLATKNKDIDAQGFIGLPDGEFIAYDRQDLYRVLLNSVEDPERLIDDELILDADDFPRYQTMVFQTTDNSVIELVNGQPTSMKTEDPAGWIKGTDIETYLRFLYVLSPENNQIYKYERLANRYTAPAEYNVNGDLEGALDMAIDGNIYLLKEGGEVMRLLRGEVKPFTIRHLPEEALKNAIRVYKVFDGHLYFLDPVAGRVLVATPGSSAGGEGTYVRQYILEGDQIGELKDIYVDEEETKMYLIDDKRIHVVDLR